MVKWVVMGGSSELWVEGTKRPRETLSQGQVFSSALTFQRLARGLSEELGLRAGLSVIGQEVVAAMRVRGGWHVHRRRRD